MINAKHLVDLALQWGADHAVRFQIGDIVFDSRTILKCAFGCGGWGYGPTCPSDLFLLSPGKYEQVLRRYSWGIIIHSTDKRISQDVSFGIEREAFLRGYYLAFSLSDCAICEECAGFVGKPCVSPQKASPAFHSVGIDVFKTVHRFGLPLDTLKSQEETPNWYSAAFIE